LNNDIQIVSSLLSRKLNEFEMTKMAQEAVVVNIRSLKEQYELTDMELDFVLNCNTACLSSLEKFRQRLTKYKDFLMSINE